jgi:hypothetical protein
MGFSVGLVFSMNPTDERTSEWYRLLAGAVGDPGASQKLGMMVQRAINDRGFALTNLGTDDGVAARRFLDVADAFLRGQNVQADLQQSQREMFLLQADLARKQVKSTHDTIERFKTGMQNALEEAESGYRITKWMYLVLFSLGVSLVVIAVIVGLMGRGDTWSTALGVIGGAGTIATLLFGQQKALESSRADLMQLEIAMFAWLDNSVRLGTSASVLLQNGGPTPALLQEFWQQSHRATADVLELVQTYCEARPVAVPAPGKAAKTPPEVKA